MGRAKEEKEKSCESENEFLRQGKSPIMLWVEIVKIECGVTRESKITVDNQKSNLHKHYTNQQRKSTSLKVEQMLNNLKCSIKVPLVTLSIVLLFGVLCELKS